MIITWQQKTQSELEILQWKERGELATNERNGEVECGNQRVTLPPRRPARAEEGAEWRRESLGW
jgi:hypothetical protein